MTKSLRGKAAVVGLGYAGLGSSPGWGPVELGAMAVERALADAGLTLAQVDGLCASTFYHLFPTTSFAEHLGIRPSWTNADMTGGSTFMAHVQQAMLAIESGLCETVVVVYGSNARSSRDIYGIIDKSELQELYQPLLPVSAYAMAAARHMHEYGTTREQLAEVVVASRLWAKGNPDAALKEPITIDGVLSSPMISDPISRADCCLVSDGGAAIVITSAERARDLRKPPVFILGCGGATWHRDIAMMPDLTTSAAVQSGKQAYEMAGVNAKEVDVAQLYDAFSILPVMFLEDLGFCAKGEGGDYVANGGIAPGGHLPVNTGGGGLSFVHPGMFGLFGIIEACIQLRGEGGERQVAQANLAIAHGNGGYFSHQATNIFGTSAAL